MARHRKLRDAEFESRHIQAFPFCVPFALETFDQTMGERFVDQHLTQSYAYYSVIRLLPEHIPSSSIFSHRNTKRVCGLTVRRPAIDNNQQLYSAHNRQLRQNTTKLSGSPALGDAGSILAISNHLSSCRLFGCVLLIMGHAQEGSQ
jgi:hypothetical protein